jgi:hypothetical protein
MARDDRTDFESLFGEDVSGSIVWRPAPNRWRSILRWTFRCLVAGVLAAGAWSLRGYYPHIAVSNLSPAPQARATSAHVESPVIESPVIESPVIEKPAVEKPAAASVPAEHIVAPLPLPKWNPPTNTRSVIRTVPE